MRAVKLERESYTKKELEQVFNLSANTVYKTLQICGLPTATQHYPVEEIRTRFVAARDMIERGLTYKQVREHFQPQTTQAQPEPEFHASGYCANTSEDASDSRKMQVFNAVNMLAQHDARDAAEIYAPLLMHHLGREMAARGNQIQEIAVAMIGTNNSETLLREGMQRSALSGDQSFGNVPLLAGADFDPALV